MRYQCHLKQGADGQWTAQHDSRDVGTVTAQASTREEVLRKIEGEIRYRLELCPCTGESYQHLDVEVVSD